MPPLILWSLDDRFYQSKDFASGPAPELLRSPPRGAWKTREKMGAVLNKGMPIYDQMSGSRVDRGRRPPENRDFAAVRPWKRRHWTFVCQRTSCDLLSSTAAEKIASSW
jgi:hypothetical protein